MRGGKRERGREGDREIGRLGREGERERGREGEREGGRESGREGEGNTRRRKEGERESNEIHYERYCCTAVQTSFFLITLVWYRVCGGGGGCRPSAELYGSG